MRNVGVVPENIAVDADLKAATSVASIARLAQRYNEEQLATLLCLGPTWVWETDAEHRFSFISKAVETATGREVKELIGRTRQECFFGAAGLTPAMVAHLDDLDNRRPFNDFVFRSAGKERGHLWVSISGLPRFDENGVFTGYIGVARGLSDQAFANSGLKNATDQLVRVETLMDDVISSVPDGIAIWNKHGVLTACNQTFCDMVAVDLPVNIGDTYEAIIRRVLADDQVLGIETAIDDWLEEDLRTMREDAAIEDIYRLQNQRWILRRVKLSPNGERVDIRTDITDLKNNEEKINAALEGALLARQVINDLTEPVFVKDANLNFMFCNDAFGAILNRNAEEFSGKRAVDFVTASEAAAFEASELEVLTHGGSNELEEDHFDGGVQKTRILRKTRITTTSGRNYVAGFMFDITALRQRESAMAAASRTAQSADKAKSDFLAQMSHEIRTPMNGVLSMTELLEQSGLDERQRVFVDIIRRSGEELLATINTILDFTQIESGSIALENGMFSPRTAVEDVAEQLVLKAAEKETEILLNIDPTLPATLLGDEGRFRQIISNLLGNAVKFTENGQIKISLAGSAGAEGIFNLALSVSDNGVGIPPDRLDHIFDRFSQITSPDLNKPQGTGLGLSIVAKLASMMGGVCHVESTLSQGSTFYVDMPMGYADLRAPSTPVSEVLRAKRILIIDADAECRNCLINPLQYWGFDVAAVEDPETAVVMAHAMEKAGQSIDLLVIGCDLPRMNCLEIARLIDGNWPTRPPTKLLLAPINADVSAQVRTKLNVRGVMTLPVKQAALYHHVVSALQSGANQMQTPPSIPELLLAHKSETSGARIDVLIAEDNPVNQLVITQILAGSGLTYQMVANGQLAVEAFSEIQPSLILMDIAMPKLNGFEASKAIRAMTALGGGEVPIIGVTASVAGQDRESCLRAGMDDHLAKPISPEALLAKIGLWLPKSARKTA